MAILIFWPNFCIHRC